MIYIRYYISTYFIRDRFYNILHKDLYTILHFSTYFIRDPFYNILHKDLYTILHFPLILYETLLIISADIHVV